MLPIIPGLTVERLKPHDGDSLGQFFELLNADGQTVQFFHPHPLTREFADELCRRSQMIRDRYTVVRFHGHIVAYAMLRGWDEGFAVPSFGGCTHPALRDAGLGKFLLAHAIDESRAAGAMHLRLSVYRSNQRAVHIYEKFGFVFSDKNEHELVGMLALCETASSRVAPPNTERLQEWLRTQRSIGPETKAEAGSKNCAA